MGFFSSITGGLSDLFTGTGGSLATGLMNPLAGITMALGEEALNFGLNERQNSMNRKHDWSIWNAQNEYNKPVNQMARFKEAGLNPNLIYGQTNMASPVHSSPGQVAKINAITEAYNLRQQDAMTQQVKANTQLTMMQQDLVHTNYLNAMDKGVNDAIHDELVNEVLQHNLDYARKHNIPVNTLPGMDSLGASLVSRVTGEASRHLEEQYDRIKHQNKNSINERKRRIEKMRNYGHGQVSVAF